MSGAVQALVAHAREIPSAERSRLAAALRPRLEPGSVLLETCHRVEVYAAGPVDLPAVTRAAGVQLLDGTAAARHMIALAVGRESAVVAEDQVLHQLRAAAHAARTRAPLAPELDRLLDIALRAGRRARSWLPARRRSLADAALDRVIGRKETPAGAILVVGAGEMGHRVVDALATRGIRVVVASRTPERARLLASSVGADVAPFDPGAAMVGGLAGVVVGLAGKWPIAPATERSIRESSAWVVDLSSPSALSSELAEVLGSRLVSIDELSTDAGEELSGRLVERLDELIESSLGEYEAWRTTAALRGAARALDEKAALARSEALSALWRRIPALAPDERAEVEEMARHLTERLLRDPLERLHEDGDGRHARAARELFRL